MDAIVPLTAAPAAPPRPLASLATLATLGGGTPPQPPQPPAMVPEATSKLMPTHVLCLRNLLNAEIMADAAELAECVDDIRGECESFGKLAAFVVPTLAALQGHGAADVGACFVKCAARRPVPRQSLPPAASPAASPCRSLAVSPCHDPTIPQSHNTTCARGRYEAIVSAAKAQDALDGRDFDGNAVSATFLPSDSM